MSVDYADVIAEKSHVIPIHFKVLEHSLPLREFITAAQSTETIIEDFNEQFFGGKLVYEIIVLPPAPGTFKERLGLKVTQAGVMFLLGAATPEFASGVVKELTGKSFFELGQSSVQTIQELPQILEEVWDESLVAVFLAEATKGFFQKDISDLEQCGLEKAKFRNAYKGRNDFYEMCYRNPEITGIGFDETENFPIQRNDFPRFIVDIPEEKPEEEDDNWEVEITHIRVTSPNWERGDNRTWKARYGEGKEVYFVIEDDNFWGLVDAERLTLKGKDSIKVQWAYVKEGERRKKVKVLKVLEYNGLELSKPLSDEELSELLYSFSMHKNEQPDLFEKE